MIPHTQIENVQNSRFVSTFCFVSAGTCPYILCLSFQIFFWGGKGGDLFKSLPSLFLFYCSSSVHALVCVQFKLNTVWSKVVLEQFIEGHWYDELRL